VLVDLDLQFGDVASALKLAPDHTVRDAVQAPRLDPTTIKVFLTAHRNGLFALCAPPSPVDADEIDAEHLQRILELLVTSFDYVVVDTASGLDEAALVAIELSTDLVLLTAPDVPCVRGTRKEVEALELIGDPAQRWHFVLNRADARTGLSTSDIEETVGLHVDVAVPESRAVPLALNQGIAMLESDPRSGVSQAVLEVVDRLAPKIAAPTSTNGDHPHPGSRSGSRSGSHPGGRSASHSGSGLFRRSR
jgi:pilus assembly protein CpaE